MVLQAKMMRFKVRDVLIPLSDGHAADRGWTAATDHRPVSVTWHWTATRTLAECRALLGGEAPLRRGRASAHLAIGRSFAEGVDRYVSLEDRSWHAGLHQTLRWDGEPLIGPELKAARTSIGIETVNFGYARKGYPSAPDWLPATSPDGRWHLRVEPWSEEQIAMMVEIGKAVVARWPHISALDHHGHHDICPGYKVDVVGFPFARILRGIYDDSSIPDIWTPFWTLAQRCHALAALGYDVEAETQGWSGYDRALRSLQRRQGLVENGQWTVFVSRRVNSLLVSRGLTLE